VPPLAVVPAKAAVFHDRTELLTVLCLGRRDAFRAVMGDQVHQVMTTAHGDEFTGVQVIERQVDGTAPGVARLGGHVALADHLAAVDVRIVALFRRAVLGLRRPAQETVDRTLRPVAVPDEQAHAHGFGLALRAFQRRAQGRRTDDAVRQVAVHRATGEVVPAGVLRIPADARDDFVHEDEAGFHWIFPVTARDTTRSSTSVSDRPAAAIILG
jgi:hypothetical protein